MKYFRYMYYKIKIFVKKEIFTQNLPNIKLKQHCVEPFSHVHQWMLIGFTEKDNPCNFIKTSIQYWLLNIIFFNI